MWGPDKSLNVGNLERRGTDTAAGLKRPCVPRKAPLKGSILTKREDFYFRAGGRGRGPILQDYYKVVTEI